MNEADGLSSTNATSGFITKQPGNIELLQGVNKNRAVYASLTFLHGTHEVLALYNKIMLLCVLSMKVRNHWLACLKQILVLTMDKAVLLYDTQKLFTDTWQLCQLVARSCFFFSGKSALLTEILTEMVMLSIAQY